MSEETATELTIDQLLAELRDRCEVIEEEDNDFGLASSGWVWWQEHAEELASLVRDLDRRLGQGQVPEEWRRGLAVAAFDRKRKARACPVCGVAAGADCLDGGVPVRWVHWSRYPVDAAIVKGSIVRLRGDADSPEGVAASRPHEDGTVFVTWDRAPEGLGDACWVSAVQLEVIGTAG